MLTATSRRRATILPAAITVGELPSDCRRWVARGDLSEGPAQSDAAERVLAALDLAGEITARAALRYLGQTGRWPREPVAAADPVHFEAALDHLRAYAVDAREVLAPLCARLNERLGEDEPMRFEAHGNLGYVFSAGLEHAAERPVAAIDGAEPGPFMPEGSAGAAYQRLMSEIQMVLHDAPVNEALAEAGQRTVNGLWIWGLGERTQTPERDLPTLHADDALLAGLWQHAGREHREVPASLADCELEGDLVVVADPCGTRDVALIDEARALQRRGYLDEVELCFADGTNVIIRPWHRLRIWRRVPEPPR